VSLDVKLGLIGLGIGLLVGVTGVGGGSLMTPILIFLGFDQSVAVGTDLVYTAVTRSIGAVIHFRQRTVNLQAVRWLASGSVPSAIVTTIIVAHFLSSEAASTQTFIQDALSIVLLFVALGLLMRPLLQKWFKSLGSDQPGQNTPSTEQRRQTFAVGVGVLVGTLVALTSVGGGSITIVALVVLLNTASTSELIGTDVFHAAILSIAAASVRIGVFDAFGIGKPVDYHAAFLLLIGSIPGVVIGSRLTIRVPDQVLRYGLAITLAAVGLRLLFFT
jgi:uncharacterized membrane protein YfcA